MEIIEQINENIKLKQLSTGLTYGTDAFLLAAYLRNRPHGTAVELGCGTGVISLLVASRGKFSHIIATEIQESYVLLTQHNIMENHLSNTIEVMHADIRQFGQKECGREVDVVFSNPPYMRTDTGKRNQFDEKYIARHEVYGNIFDFCQCASRLLKTGGLFVCVYRPDRLIDLTSAMRLNRLEPKKMTFVYGDVSATPSIVLIESAKDGAPGLQVTRPLILYKDNPSVQPRQYTEQAQFIYDTCTWA